jgi:hypothetical protein
MTHTNLDSVTTSFIRRPRFLDGVIQTSKESGEREEKQTLKSKSFREIAVQIRQRSEDKGVQVEKANESSTAGN